MSSVVAAGVSSSTATQPQQPTLLQMSFSFSSASSVPPLPLPIGRLSKSISIPPKPMPSHVDSLTLEMEVQDLTDRVTSLEEGHAHVLEVQKSILNKQDDILSRLIRLEKNQSHHYDN